jgi:bifunctional non-homologous end joining protein LigD
MADLSHYKSKRNFSRTPEPAEGGEAGVDALSFVIQKHWATRLHYDFRLELDGTMKSWAVPKGPSFDPRDKRMAVQVEDHPISYSSFEGEIPKGEYGAGKVIIWDKGWWQPIGDPEKGMKAGNLKFELHGTKLHGKWALIRMKGDEKKPAWLLIKEKDDSARSAEEYSVVDEMPDSVAGKVKHKVAKKVEVKVKEKVETKVDLPPTLAPQLATLVDTPPSSPQDWIFEVKFDGYRMLARVEGNQVQLFTRNGNDWTHKLKSLQKEILRLKLSNGWYDGEIVVHEESGRPDFGLLQQAFDGNDTHAIVFYLFDLPFHRDADLRSLPLLERRARLQDELKSKASELVRFSTELGNDAGGIYAAACEMGLEGIIGKRRDAPYVSRRSRDWVKLKCGQRQEFVIAGYTDPEGKRNGFGSLLLGTYDSEHVLHYAGNVGTGFSERVLGELSEKLKALETKDSPFPPKTVPGKQPHWVKPSLVAEVSFAEWTKGGSVRHATFVGLRDDKPAKQVAKEVAKTAKNVAKNVNEEHPKITHGERVIDPSSGITKLELVRYYMLVSKLLMPHLKERPASLVRAPAGIAGSLFFQKHAEVDKLPGIAQVDIDTPPLLEIAKAEGILSAAQWNVVEFHTQNARSSAYDKPDRIVLDLDPGEGVDWHAVQTAADVVHGMLDALGLPAFLKTSGGKGLHIVLPVKPEYDWDTVKDFSKALVQHLASTLPDRFAAKSGPRNRVGRIFVDYLRNGQGATTVSAWSARARPGLGISVPLDWDELGSVKAGDQWHVGNAQTRLDRGNSPWDAYAKSARKLDAAFKKFSYSP